MDLRYSRCETLFGEENFKKLQTAKVLILGVGGVGGFALDCLYRSGINNITIVDFDTFEITNQNRQIGSENIGKVKVFTLAEIYPKINPIHIKIDKDFVDNFNFEPFDVVVDAIDDIDAKVAIAKKTYPKLLSSMGSAKKIDTSKIEVTSIWKTHGDKFAKKFRDKLKKERFNKNFKVVFSPEEPKCKELGSFVGVTGSFGLSLCSLTINKILND